MASRPQAPFAFPAGAKATTLEPGIIARAVAGVRYALSGNPGWFGPGQPLNPVADKPEDGTAGRAFDYGVGFNQRTIPRGEEPVSFAQMRALADNCDLVRLAIETRKDQFAKLKWKARRKDGGDDDAKVKAVTDALMQPDREHGFGDWSRMLLEDLLVIDAPTIYPRKTRGGGLYSLDLVDGATIKRVLDVTGRTPIAPDPAYQQILKGMPAIDYTREELIYRPRNVRTSRVYGFSPVEQIIITVNIALRRQANQLSYYTEGNTPNLVWGTPPEWTPDQVAAFQRHWDSLTSNGQSKHTSRFVPGGITPYDTKAGALKDEYDEWLARIVMYAFSVSAQPFIKQMNRSTSETAHQQALEEGLAPLQVWMKSVIDQCIAGPMGMPDIEFVWDEEEAIDPLVQAEVNKIYIDAKVITADEVREDLGKPPLTPQQREELTPPAPVAPTVDDMPAIPGEPKPAVGKFAKGVKKKADFDGTVDTLTAVLTDFLEAQAPKVAAQLSKRLGLAKSMAEDDPRPFEAVDAVEIDWKPLVKKMHPVLVTMAVDSGGDALTALGLFDAETKALMTKDATAAAKDRAAELVGMKWVDGKLVPNPDAKWRIDDATRDMIKATATQAVQEGWSNQRLASELKDTHAFSADRAENIARTETARAQTDGSIVGWKVSGVVGGKKWSAGADCCDICQELDGTVVALDEEFEDGDPPLHPSCRCGLDAVLTDDMEA